MTVVHASPSDYQVRAVGCSAVVQCWRPDDLQWHTLLELNPQAARELSAALWLSAERVVNDAAAADLRERLSGPRPLTALEAPPQAVGSCGHDGHDCRV